MLFGANLNDARSFAVESAASRGWRILSVSTRSAVFEQILAGDDASGVLVAERLLRIYANFSEESDGARVTLRAEEVEWPGTEDEWRSDVTERYAENLDKALASLRGKWDTQRPGDNPSADARGMGSLIGESTGASPGAGAHWAYAAERYAQSRGCVLTERVTQLASSGQDWEEHRVFCQDGSQILVQCRYGDCTSRP
ncbi:hypothetical protein CKO23_09965 [Thiocystis violacea]|nr:hypothetical protein [Thiocystis violacea]